MNQDPVEVANDVRLTSNVWRGALALLVYDYALTFSSEVEMMWEYRWRWSTFLFYVNRYWPMLSTIIAVISTSLPGITNRSCLITYYWYCYGCLVTQLALGLILTLRVYALYDQNKRILWALCLLMGSAVSCQFIIVSLNILKLKPVYLFSHVPGLENCVPNNWAANGVYYWAPGILLESVLFLFVCLKLFQVVLAGERAPGLLAILVRDSMLSYGGALVFLLVNAVVYATARQTMYTAFTITVPCSQSIIGCRMMLNLREAANCRAWRCEDDVRTPNVPVSEVIVELEERNTFLRSSQQESQQTDMSPHAPGPVPNILTRS